MRKIITIATHRNLTGHSEEVAGWDRKIRLEAVGVVQLSLNIKPIGRNECS